MSNAEIEYQVVEVVNEPVKYRFHLIGFVGKRKRGDLVSIDGQPCRFSSPKLAAIAAAKIITDVSQIRPGCPKVRI